MVKFILWWEMIGFPNYFCEVVSTLLCFRSVFDQFSHLYIHTVCCSIHNIYDIWMKLCWTCFIIHCKCCIWLHNIWRWIFNLSTFNMFSNFCVRVISLWTFIFFNSVKAQETRHTVLVSNSWKFALKMGTTDASFLSLKFEFKKGTIDIISNQQIK